MARWWIQAARPDPGIADADTAAVVDAPATLARTPITDTATTTDVPTALSVTLAASMPPRRGRGHVLGRCRRLGRRRRE